MKKITIESIGQRETQNNVRARSIMQKNMSQRRKLAGISVTQPSGVLRFVNFRKARRKQAAAVAERTHHASEAGEKRCGTILFLKGGSILEPIINKG
ncbi:hypothetical protein MNR02_03885 [Shinella sp. H4-D48]|uniref:hypothetical protein n=1 Tax=unclassified Shinella TaxID=2643062 RepID=UPI001F539622|nr:MULTISPECIES: hypothetical protein [unclassified Shinella]UNK38855.1 hypothetical protein MNR02_03885 [Shinella sp. H4-D48]